MFVYNMYSQRRPGRLSATRPALLSVHMWDMQCINANCFGISWATPHHSCKWNWIFRPHKNLSCSSSDYKNMQFHSSLFSVRNENLINQISAFRHLSFVKAPTSCPPGFLFSLNTADIWEKQKEKRMSKAFKLVQWSRIGTLAGARVQRKVLAAGIPRWKSPTNFVTTHYFTHFYSVMMMAMNDDGGSDDNIDCGDVLWPRE